MTDARILLGDCIAIMQTLEPESIDAVVCDPPYGLEFMGKDWDKFSDRDLVTRTGHDRASSGAGFGTTRDGSPLPTFGGRLTSYECAVCHVRDAFRKGCRCDTPDWRAINPNGTAGAVAFQRFSQQWAEAAYRVLKPGGHVLAFGGTRTYHRLTAGLEDAGFEIRDSLHWIYASGFPKSLSVHKASIAAIESRYGDARCDCLDTGDGREDRVGVRRNDRGGIGAAGGSGAIPAAQARDTDVPLDAGAGDTAVRVVREGGDEAAEASPEGVPSLLLADVCGSGAEAARLGDAEVRAGVEERQGEDQAPRPDVPLLRKGGGGEREGVDGASPQAVQVRRDEPPKESSGALRGVSSDHRGDHDECAGVDPDRREARRVCLDGRGGRGGAVARVCSWCGLPDPGWVGSLVGAGTALKPAHEPIVLARKPLGGTVTENVLAHGTGALNIDAAREGANGATTRGDTSANRTGEGKAFDTGHEVVTVDAGRWPANVLLAHLPECEGSGAAHTDVLCADGCPVAELNEASGESTSPAVVGRGVPTNIGPSREGVQMYPGLGDSGGAARFFYIAKPRKRERVGGTIRNLHPTVKPIDLMRHLVRLVTPPGGVVLDPFLGSGSTGCAAMVEGFRFVGIEADAASHETSLARISDYAFAHGRERPVTD